MRNKPVQVLALFALIAGLIACATMAPTHRPRFAQRLFSGEIASIDTKDHTIRVDSWLGTLSWMGVGALSSRRFQFAEDAVISLGLSNNAAMEELKCGMQVCVTYTDVEGRHVASRIAQRLDDYPG